MKIFVSSQFLKNYKKLASKNENFSETLDKKSKI